jgi:hypothetical protein
MLRAIRGLNETPLKDIRSNGRHPFKLHRTRRVFLPPILAFSLILSLPRRSLLYISIHSLSPSLYPSHTFTLAPQCNLLKLSRSPLSWPARPRPTSTSESSRAKCKTAIMPILRWTKSPTKSFTWQAWISARRQTSQVAPTRRVWIHQTRGSTGAGK